LGYVHSAHLIYNIEHNDCQLFHELPSGITSEFKVSILSYFSLL